MNKVTVTRRFHVHTEDRGRKRVCRGSATPVEHVPRVAKLMALAISFDQMIREGVVADQAELARIGKVSRARLTQIMNLISLAPSIQTDVLNLPSDMNSSQLTERKLRRVAATPCWQNQQSAWSARKESDLRGL